MADHIQIGDIAPRIQYSGDGSQAAFAYPFPIFSDGDMRVYLDAALQETGFAISGAGIDNGGSVTFDAAPAEGVVVTLLRDVTIQRTADFQESGEFRAKVINDELDKEVAMIQQVSDRVQRSLRLAETDSAGSLLLPDKSARAGRLLGFDGDGNPIAAAGDTGGVAVSGFMATVLDDADANDARATLGLTVGTDVLAPDGDGSQLSGIGGADQVARDNTVLNAFEIARIDGLSTYAMVNTVIDAFTDETGVDTGASVNQTYDATGDYYHNPGGTENVADQWAATYTDYSYGASGPASDFDTESVPMGQHNASLPWVVQVDFGSGVTKEILGGSFYVHTAYLGTRAGSWHYSDDGSSWTDAVTFNETPTGDADFQKTWSSVGAHLYWRLRMTSYSGSNYCVIDYIRLYATAAAADMTLVSEAITAASAPADMRVILDHEEVDSATPNTDCTIELTRDGGTTWTAGVLAQTVDAGSGRQTLACDIDVTGQPSGTSVKWRFKTLNNKQQRLHKIGVQADAQLTV